MKKQCLILEINKQNNSLFMNLHEKEDSGSTLRSYLENKIDFLEVERLCNEISSLLNKIIKSKELTPIENLRKVSHLLFDILLHRYLKDMIKELNDGQDMIIFIDEELVHIPWELLYTGKEFLCLKFNLGRIIKTYQPPIFRNYRKILSKPRMLILADPTGDLPSSYREGIIIKNYLDKKRNLIDVDFKATHIDTLYVKKNIRDYDIIHFAGHSEYNPSNPDETGWLLADGRFRVKDIYNLAESATLPSLVFSHSCFSAQIEQLNKDDYLKTFSLAGAFLYSGVRHYIGTIRRIEDDFAIHFANSFYDYLVSGIALGEALRMSRLEMIKEYGRDKNFWFSYVLYGEPTFSLFSKNKKTTFVFISREKKGILKKYGASFGIIVGISLLALVLYNFLPSINPHSYYLYLKLKRIYAQGKNHEVITIAEKIIEKDKNFILVYPELANVYLRIGKLDQALQTYFKAVALAEKKNNNKLLISSYLGIGWIYHSQGNFKEAFDFYNKSLELANRIKDKLNTAIVLRRMAVWYIDKEDYQKALELLTISSEINRENKNNREFLYNLACDYFNLGLVFVNRNDYGTAEKFYRKSREIFEKLKLKRELSDYYFNLGEIYLYEKRYQKALTYYLKGLEIDKSQKNIFNLASDYNMLGELYLEMKDFSQAEKCFFEAINFAKISNANLDLAYAYYNLAQLYREKNQKQNAREYLRYAQQVFKNIDVPFYDKIRKELEELK